MFLFDVMAVLGMTGYEKNFDPKNPIWKWCIFYVRATALNN